MTVAVMEVEVKMKDEEEEKEEEEKTGAKAEEDGVLEYIKKEIRLWVKDAELGNME